MQKKTFGRGGVTHHPTNRATKQLMSAPMTSSEAIKPLQADEVRPGDMVTHPQFGSGLIVSVSGSLATIAFKRSGVKKMMLGVAPLSKA